MKIKNITRYLDLEKHRVIWQWVENKTEMVFIETVFQRPPKYIVREFMRQNYE